MGSRDTTVNLAIGTVLLFFLIVVCFFSCAKAMTHRFVTTSLTALAIQSDNVGTVMMKTTSKIRMGA